MTTKEKGKNRRKPTKAEIKTRAAKKLESVFHPRWSSRVDYTVLAQRGLGVSFADIAKELKRDSRAVEQRWHRLRAIPNIETLLEEFGLSKRPYSLNGEVQ